MPQHRTAAVVGAAALALSLTSCGLIRTPGPQSSEDRTVPDGVTGVSLDGSGTLILSRGDAASLRVTAGEHVLDRVTSEVHGDVLHLDVRGGFLARSGPVTYDLVLPEVHQLTLEGSGRIVAETSAPDGLHLVLAGSGDVEVSDIDTGTLVVELDGSGDVVVDGRATRQEVRLDGAGSYRADGLESIDSTVDLSGAGEIAVRVSGTLDARLSGSGTISHTGGAEVTSEVSGSGDVRAD